MFDDQNILVTGGTGSFGQTFTRILLEEHSPRTIRIFSRGELAQAQMRSAFADHPKLRFLIGDVRDHRRLQRAMNGVDVVVHAAALKRVPACEYNPIEAKCTNVDGAANVIDAAIDNGVKQVMALSTDKAVNPVNLYGGTKLVAEKLFVQGNAYSGPDETRFSVVRYGNVVGSRGSVIPLWMKQRDEEGRVTITHEEMTRFWITLPQGVEFVLEGLREMAGGEIFVPKIPSMRVVDLAEAIAPDAKQEVIGIRPGEKLHEVLLTPEEARHSKEFPTKFIVEPEHAFWEVGSHNGGKRLDPSFHYQSNENDEWLSTEELRKMVEDLGYEV